MEHPCQQCGATVEDGRPFCPQCRAPQIHVQIAARDSGIAEDLNPAAGNFPANISQAGHPGFPGTILHRTTLRGAMNREIAVRAALKAGVLGVLIGIILPFVAIVVAGALAVYFYRNESGIVLPPAFGSRVGAAAGVVAMAIQSIFFTIWMFVFHHQAEYIDSVTKFVHSAGADAAIPDIEASIRSLFTPAGFVLTLLFVMILAVVLAGIGGALASLVLRPRNPGA